MTNHALHLGGDILFYFGQIPVKNTTLAVVLVDIILVVIGIVIVLTARVIPTRLQAVLEMTLEFIESIANTLPKFVRKELVPILFVWFLFILVANWIGLLPGIETIKINISGKYLPLLKGPNTDLNLTLAMAFVSFVIVEGIVLFAIGIKGWLQHFFHVSKSFLLPLFIAIGLLELILEPVKFFTLAMRLFGNILAGETLISTLSNIPLIATPFLLLEVLVGVLQALVFVTLTVSFLGLMLQDNTHDTDDGTPDTNTNTNHLNNNLNYAKK